MTTPVRVALYLRISTVRQADSDLSIPDQRRQAKRYCEERGWEIVADYVEPGMSATDDRRPEVLRKNSDADILGCNADGKGENDRRLIRSDTTTRSLNQAPTVRSSSG